MAERCYRIYINTSVCTRIPIPKDRQADFNNYLSLTKDQVSEEIVLTLFCHVAHPDIVCPVHYIASHYSNSL